MLFTLYIIASVRMLTSVHMKELAHQELSAQTCLGAIAAPVPLVTKVTHWSQDVLIPMNVRGTRAVAMRSVTTSQAASSARALREVWATLHARAQVSANI